MSDSAAKAISIVWQCHWTCPECECCNVDDPGTGEFQFKPTLRAPVELWCANCSAVFAVVNSSKFVQL